MFLWQAPVTSNQQSITIQEPVEDTVSQDGNSDTIVRTPPSKSSGLGSSAATTPAGNHTPPVPVNVTSHNLSGVSTAPTILPGSSSVRVTESTGATNSSSPVNLSVSVKEEEITNFPGRRSSPSLSDSGLVRGIGRGGLSSQSSSSIPLSPSNIVPGSSALGTVPSASDIAKRNMLGADERLGNSSMVQPPVSPLSSRMILPQTAKANDGTSSIDSSNVGEAAAMSGRVFSPSVVSGMQWRPGSSFQNQNEAVCYFVLLYLKKCYFMLFLTNLKLLLCVRLCTLTYLSLNVKFQLLVIYGKQYHNYLQNLLNFDLNLLFQSLKN